MQTKTPKINVLPWTQLIIIYLLKSVHKMKKPHNWFFYPCFKYFLTCQPSWNSFVKINTVYPTVQGLQSSPGDIISYLSFQQMVTLHLSWTANSSDLGPVFQARRINSFLLKKIGIVQCKKLLKYKHFSVLHFIYKCLCNYFYNRAQDMRRTKKTEQATTSRTRRFF